MRLRDAFLLAKTKFQTRKVRSILTALAAGFMLTILITGSFMITSLRAALVPADSTILEDRHFARQYQYVYFGEEDRVNHTRDSYRESNANWNPKNIFVDISPEANFSIEGAEEDLSEPDFFGPFGPGSQVSIQSRDNELLLPYVWEGRSLDYDGTGPVPLILSTDYVLSQEKVRFSGTESAEDRISRTRTTLEKYIDKEMVINMEVFNYDYESYGPPTVEESESASETFKVIGFTPAASTLLDSYSETFVPAGAVSQSAYAEQFRDDGTKTANFIVEFETKEQRDAFLASGCSLSDWECFDPIEVWNDPQAKFDQLFKEFIGFFKYIIFALAAIVATSMFVTISKIMSDSERETGVFRAIGAKRLDIVKIYFIYSLLIAATAYVLAFLVSLLFALYLTSKFGNSFAFQIAQLTGSSSAEKITLIGIDIPQQLVVFGIGAGAAILGAAIPIFGAVRRDPIKAMRDE